MRTGNGDIRAYLSRCDVVRADVVSDVIDTLYAVGLYLAATAERADGTVVTRLENAVREVDKVVRTLQGSVAHARAAAIDGVGIDEVVAAMTFVDRSVGRLSMNAPTGTELTSSLIDAGHAARWALQSLEDVRRSFHASDQLGGSS